MATMNTPPAGDSNWYRAVTDNWTSIEKNLIDQSVVSAKGDLLTAATPFAPTRLGVGSDGQLLIAQSTQPTGLQWNTLSSLDNTTYMDKLVYDKRFFSAAGLLPGTQVYETPAGSAPKPGFDQTGVVPITLGSFKRWPNIGQVQFLGWDLGGLKHRVLIICSEYWAKSGPNTQIFVSTALPTSGDFTTGDNGYMYGQGEFYPIRIDNGAGTGLSSAATYVTDPGLCYGYAFLFDSGNLRYFYRYGNYQWLEGTYINDGTYTTMRYVGIRTQGLFMMGPVSVWYDA